MENLLSVQRTFVRVTLKRLFQILCWNNRRIDTGTIFQNLVHSNSMSRDVSKSIKPVGTMLGTIYGLFKV